MTRATDPLQKELHKHLECLYSRAQAEEYAARLAETARACRGSRSCQLAAWDRGVPDDWFRSHERVAYSLYAQLFAGAAREGSVSPLQRLADQIDYFAELGADILHVLPFLKSSIDDGFGVDDYGAVDERLGTREDFGRFVQAAHAKNIFVAADFVLNHVSTNHDWARRAEDGETAFERFFYWDQTGTGDRWPHVADVFPEFAPGHWDYVPKRDRWVWATFYKRWPQGAMTKQWPAGQWDLNYHEPEVLLGMVRNLLELANWGIDVFRLDAVPFIWKQRGTACENLDEVYSLLAVFRLCLKVVAPRAVMLAEWNAPLPYLRRYFQGGGELAYNFRALPMLWEAVRLGRVRGLREAFEALREPADAEGRDRGAFGGAARSNGAAGDGPVSFAGASGFDAPGGESVSFAGASGFNGTVDGAAGGDGDTVPGTPDGESSARCGVFWLFNECHDELNLGDLSRERVQALSGRFWAAGAVPFRCERAAECGECHPAVERCFRDGERYPTGVCGTTYSLLGGPEDQAAEARLRLMWSLKLSLGGTPLFYMGEEQGTVSDGSRADGAALRSDSRHVKRVPLSLEQVQTRGGERARFFRMLQGLIAWRKKHPIVMAEPEFFDTGSESVLGFRKYDGKRTAYFLANCSGDARLALVPIEDSAGEPESVGPDHGACRWERVCVGQRHALAVELQAYGFEVICVGGHCRGAA